MGGGKCVLLRCASALQLQRVGRGTSTDGKHTIARGRGGMPRGEALSNPFNRRNDESSGMQNLTRGFFLLECNAAELRGVELLVAGISTRRASRFLAPPKRAHAEGSCKEDVGG